MKKKDIDFASLLRKKGYKATPARLLILDTLCRQKYPVNIGFLCKKLKGKIDQVTIYRTLNSLADSKIVERNQIDNISAYYELSLGRKHHHHIVCTKCHKVEDFSGNEYMDLTKKVISKSKFFSKITSHALELYGLCNSCAKKQ